MVTTYKNKNPYSLCIVIVNYKTPDMVIDCLESFFIELNNKTMIVIVDNASNDSSIEKISLWVNQKKLTNIIKIIASPYNGGFSSGNNIGIKSVSADYYLLLNSDTLMRKNSISIMLDKIKQEKNIGLLAPRLEWPDCTSQESCFNFHTSCSELISSAKTGFITKLLHKYKVPQPVSESYKFYDWVSFACVMIRAEVLGQIGLMDEKYFMYFEDVEFCHRAKQAGWHIGYEPNAHVVHLRGGSSPVKAQAKLRKRLPRYFYESRTRYFFQVYGKKGLFLANLLWTLGWLISSTRSLLSKSYLPDTSEKQWLDIWTNFMNPEKPYVHPDCYGK